MPSIITDDMVKEMCSMSRPIPITSTGFLSHNNKVGFTPTYIKRGRGGIRPVALPIYPPASVASLIQSTCNLSKLDKVVVTEHIEQAIAKKIPVSVPQDLGAEGLYGQYDTEYQYQEQPGSASETPIELMDQDTQTTASEMAGTKSLRKGYDEEGEVLMANPSNFKSADSEPVMENEMLTDAGTGTIDVNDPRGSQGGFVGRPSGTKSYRELENF
jgi:hypothetical protein